MFKWTQYVILKKEAHLFDSKLYILKAFIAVITAYTIAIQFEFVSKDMISVLFGLLLTLEPVTITGIRSGLKQIYATLLGALCTAIIISILGINLWTIALSICATLFLCLKINWREVSPVAIFTSIYMTQYIQLAADGSPSVLLTFQLRILALGVGVFIAIFYNFIFSLFSYKKMERKRIAFIFNSLAIHLKKVQEGIVNHSSQTLIQERNNLPQTFNGIDWLCSLIKDKEKEAAYMNKLHIKNNYLNLVNLEKNLLSIRTITHLIYDSTYILNNESLSLIDQEVFVSNSEQLIKSLLGFSEYFENANNNLIIFTEKYNPPQVDNHNQYTSRLWANFTQINDVLKTMSEEL
ncbi:MAG: hypothetical protein CVU84_02520 [Firmicutes bacterium HGW-Firmicutes-1]|jgi:uncharacterized membrane protein YgaE (UPF0421/DUF939 family)|nr:MAG: hypothetical protein CVU84_02520 [Firmicutes bacterium HGW-Firmicutes-1]